MKNGIYENLSIEDYHNEAEHFSASQLKAAADTLKDFKYGLDTMGVYTRKKHFDFGNAFETALMSIDTFDDCVAVFEETKVIDDIMAKRPELKVPRNSKEYKEERAKFETENDDKYQIVDYGEHSLEAIEAMVLSCSENATIAGTLRGCGMQQSILWTDKATGLNLKTRPDINKKNKGALVDIKTSRKSCSPYDVAGDIRDFRYWLQACIQIKGALQAKLVTEDYIYLWLFVEKNPPFKAQLYEFHKEDITTAMAKTDEILAKVATALKTNYYPGYEADADNKYGILRAQIW